MSAKHPNPDRDAILAGLAALFDPSDVIELRAIYSKGKKRTDAGYFDGEHREALANEAARLNTAGAAVYVTLNRLDPQLLGRYCNRVEAYATATATDANVTRRRWLLLDFDPTRPKDTSATDAQLEAAKATARACYQALQAEGWPDPLAAESGNGFHLLYPLDLPNDNASRDLVKGALSALAARFDDDAVKLDQSVFNAGRITKLYGTVANKGDHTLSTPWRLSRLVSTPTRGAVVTADQLCALQRPETAKPADVTRSPANRERQAGFDLVAFLGRLGIPYQHDTHEGRNRYKLAYCPFNEDHGKGEAAIFQEPGGKLGFKCQHNGCADKAWSDVRALVDGPAYQAKSIRSTGASTYGHAWPEPQPLPEGLPPVAAFDYALLPDTLQPWARDICERVQCAPDYVGAAIMAGLGSVIGRKLGIRPQARTDWTVTPNQWALVIGRPGVLKSPAMEAALSPLKRLASQATQAHKMEMEDYRRAAKMAKLKAEEGEKAARKVLAKDASADVSTYLDAEEPEAPALRRYIANDTTAAALGELHRQNHNGLLVFRDELVSLLKSLDREDNAEARGFYLTGWNGDSPYTFDRITRGMNLHIPAVCLSLLGSTQPGRIAEYIRQAVRGGSGDDGLIQRFGLLVWPDNGGDWRDVDRWPDSEAKQEANRVFEALDRLDPANVGAQQDTGYNGEPDGMPYLRFDPRGLGLFLEWRADLELRLRGGELHPAMESHLAKYRKLVPGLALILHLAGGDTGPVSERVTLQALAWSEYLETHARRAYASVTTPELSAAKAIIQRLRKGDLPRMFSSRDVWRPGWAMLSDREQVGDALRLLVDLDWLAMTKQETAGRTATVYEANSRGLAV